MLDLLLSLSSDAILLFNEQGEIVRANSIAIKVFGYPLKELLGRSIDMLIPERFQARQKAFLTHILSVTEKRHEMSKFRYGTGKRKNGKEIPVKVSVGWGETEGQMLVIARIRDLSKQAEEHANRELFAQVLGVIGNLVLVSNSAGEIIYVGPSVKDLLGYEASELLGEGWWEIERQSGGDVEAERMYVKQAAAGKTTIDGAPYEHRIRHKDGSWRTFMLADSKGPDDLLIGIGTDITKLKGSEEKVKENEARYRLAISAADAVPYNLSYALNQYTLIGEEIERITGYDRDELTPDKFTELIQESTMRGKFEGMTTAQATEVVRGGDGDGVWRCDFRILTKSGESRWLSDTSVQVRDAQDHLTGSMGILQDVTARKLVELQLQSERDFSLQVMNTMRQGLTITDADGRFEYVNPAYVSMLGYNANELTGKTFSEMTASVLSEHSNQETDPSASYEARLLHKDGRDLFALITSVPHQVSGQFGGFISVITDLTERRRMEKALRESEGAIRSLYGIAARQDSFENKLQAFLKMGLERFELPNAALAYVEDNQYIVVAAESPQNMSKAGDSFPLENTFSQIVLSQGQLLSIEHIGASQWAEHPCYQLYKLEAYLGMPVYVADHVYGTLSFSGPNPRQQAFTDRDKDLISLMGQWIGAEIERTQATRQLEASATEIERKNKDLAEARDRALDASYLKSAFLATMSHEIRTPMNAIIGMNELLLDTSLDADQREFATIIGDSAHALLTILNDILDFSKIEAGKLTIKPEQFSPQRLVRDVTELFRVKAIEKNIQIGWNVVPIIPTTLLGDAVRIRQILTNFLSNAIKFTEKGSIQLDLNGTFITEGTIMITFTIRDTGIGISESARARLFEPFTQADGSITRKYGGTGLGLAISRRLVDLMHGEIGIISEEGVGSTFWFSLPLGYTPLSHPTLPKPITPSWLDIPAESSLPIFTDCQPILLVEDNIANQQVIAKQLEVMGLSTHLAATGAEALKLLNETPAQFSAILMDLNMPDMDGLSATRLIRQDEKTTARHIPIIAVTANALAGDREICLSAGMDAYLAKPLKMMELALTLKNFLDNHSK